MGQGWYRLGSGAGLDCTGLDTGLGSPGLVGWGWAEVVWELRAELGGAGLACLGWWWAVL
jgi:hypothetical protein